MRHWLNESYITNEVIENENKTDIAFCFFFSRDPMDQSVLES